MKGRKDLLILFLGFVVFVIGAIGISRYAFCNGLLDQIWTYSDSSYNSEAVNFADGNTVYIEVSDTVTTGSPKIITVKNNTIGNEISVELNEDTQTKYRGTFIVYSGANDDENDKLAIFTGQSATITADLSGDGIEGTKTINSILAAYINLSDPSPVKAGDITITLTTSNKVVKVPTPLILTFNDETTLEITLTGNVPGNNFTGNFTVDESTPEGEAIFSLSDNALEDQKGNTSNIILSGEALSIDITLPPSPTNLSASLSKENVQISWNASFPENDVQKYKLYRSDYPGAKSTGNLIATISANGSSSYSWLDTGAGKGKFYYVVVSEDLAGNISSPSNEIFIEAKELLSLSFVQSIAREGRPVRIIIGVNQPVDITIRIFNLKGYIVYNWSDYITSEREWSWTGVNMHGQIVNNGTYICRITAKGADGSVVDRKKILGVLY